MAMQLGKMGVMVLLALGLAGCAAQDVTRATADMTALVATDDTRATEQAVALRDMTQTMLRKATLRGATMGAVVGCGMATVVGDGGCLQAAVIGGAIGGLAGQADARRNIARQIEIVQPAKVLPTLTSARAQLRQVQTTVPALLAAQDAELADLHARVATGAVPQSEYDGRLAAIRQARTDLAAALLSAAEQTRATRDAMTAARDQGQDGLDWYLSTTEEMERKVMSTRSTISLL